MGLKAKAALCYRDGLNNAANNTRIIKAGAPALDVRCTRYVCRHPAPLTRTRAPASNKYKGRSPAYPVRSPARSTGAPLRAALLAPPLHATGARPRKVYSDTPAGGWENTGAAHIVQPTVRVHEPLVAAKGPEWKGETNHHGPVRYSPQIVRPAYAPINTS